MAEIKPKPINKTPEPTLRRLPWYLAYLKIMHTKETSVVSSTQIAGAIGIDASQVAKDLSYVDISGKTRVGYEVDQLIEVLELFLGFNRKHKAIIFGAGSLGKALILDSGLNNYGLEIVAGFDVRADLIGTTINGISIYHPDECGSLRGTLDAEIGILTVPPDKAQEVTNIMVDGGLKAIWNFTPFRVKVPENIVLQDTSLFSHLAVIFNSLNQADL
ncbi:MAG: redox-sensing transcriptional repressor Rex [Bacteroidales bacterium]|nr:redox-sensing transcriptional repressor Rex [Bacteroidales bacterium]